MTRPPRCPETGKVSYWTRKKALRAAAARVRATKTKLTAYDCPHCDFWHLTRQVKRTKKERQARRERRHKEAPEAKVTPLQPKKPKRTVTPREQMQQVANERAEAEARQRRATPGSAEYKRALEDISNCRRRYLEIEHQMRRAA